MRQTRRSFLGTGAGLDGWIMALDGMPLAEPQQIGGDIVLGPGQRADLFVDVVADDGATADLARRDRDDSYSQVAFRVAGSAAPAPRPAPPPLPPNPNMDLPDLAGARRITPNMAGGAMGRMSSAMLHGQQMTMQQLVQAGQFWALNGVAGMTDTPLAVLHRNEAVRLTMVNDTAWPHAMHLHATHLHELGPDGTPGPLRDTVLMASGETREVALVADNPGKWLFHCHMLSHAASGMMTWIEVA